MPLTNATFNDAAQRIHYRIHEYDKGWRSLSPEDFYSILYDMLTRRDSKEIAMALYDAYFKNHEEEYANCIKSLPFKYPTTIGSDITWTSIDYPHTVKRPLIVNDYKIYFTVEFKAHENPYNAFEEIKQFVNIMPPLRIVVEECSSVSGDYVHFKFINNLLNFVNHPDHLVIYYYKPESSERIYSAVRNLLIKGGIKLADRKIRPNFAFDLETGSHSQLIARVISRKLVAQVDSVRQLNNAKLAGLIRELVRDYSHSTIELIIKELS